MPKPSTPEVLKRRIFEAVENNPKASAGAIRLALLRSRADTVVPSERTIARIKKDFLGRQPEEKRQYRWFSWPQSMLDGSLPWEASPICFDLLRYSDQCKTEFIGIPTLSDMQWFYRITLAAPDLDVAQRLHLARLASDGAFKGMQHYLQVAPWRSRSALAAYNRLLKQGAAPLEPLRRLQIVSIEVVRGEKPAKKEKP